MSKNIIHNIPAFVRSYLQSESGKAALSRRSIIVVDKHGKRTGVWRTNQIAEAFQQALA